MPKPPVRTDLPFGQALRNLMEYKEFSYRQLAARTALADGRGLTHAHLNMMANGHDPVSNRAMELIAAACNVRPEYFAEYRLNRARSDLDPNVVGLDQALKNLERRLRRSGRSKT